MKTTTDPKLSLELNRALYGRDGYVGTFPQPVVDVRPPLRLLSYTRASNGLQVDVLDGETARRFRAEHADHGELMRLGDYDRATLQAALILIAQGGGDG